MPALRFLDLDSCGVTDAGCANLPMLVRVRGLVWPTRARLCLSAVCSVRKSPAHMLGARAHMRMYEV